MSEQDDDLVGELFADKDPRSEGRVVRVVKRIVRSRPGGLQTAYVVSVVKSPFGMSIGRISTISADNLQKRYKKVSH